MLLGAHEGIAGGVSKAFARAEADGADCVQIFTRNARGWAAKALEEEEVAAFRGEARRTGLPVAAHSSYLINCASARKAATSSSSRGFAAQPRALRVKICTQSAPSASARANAFETPPAMPSCAPSSMGGSAIHQTEGQHRGLAPSGASPSGKPPAVSES